MKFVKYHRSDISSSYKRNAILLMYNRGIFSCIFLGTYLIQKRHGDVFEALPVEEMPAGMGVEGSAGKSFRATSARIPRFDHDHSERRKIIFTGN